MYNPAFAMVKFLVFLMILSVAAMLLISVGGREFDMVELTSHWIEGHQECKQIKSDALSPESKWRWDMTPRGQCAFYKDMKTGLWIVIILIVVVSRGKKKITLITGYNPDENDPNKWLKRSSNR